MRPLFLRSIHHRLQQRQQKLLLLQLLPCEIPYGWTRKRSRSGSLRQFSSSTKFPPLHKHPSRILSSVGSIYKPPKYFLGTCEEEEGPLRLPNEDTIVSESVRSCIKIDEDDPSSETTSSSANWKNLHEKGLPTEMSLCFLGTGAGSPANTRSTSGTLLRMAGTNFLLDAGEGTQKQLQFAKGSSLSKIEKIFVTHLHGDHIFGLPGLLLSMQTSIVQQTDDKTTKKQQQKREEIVRIYGPPGLYNYLASAIAMSCTRLHLLNVHVYELTGGRVRRVTPGRRDPFHGDYPELKHSSGRLRRFQIPCEHGIWNIQKPPLPLSREDLRKRSKRATSQQEHNRLTIQAAEVDHMPGVATFGFVFQEDEPPRNLDVTKAKALGVSHRNKNYELLKHGFSVVADLEGPHYQTTVEAQDVLLPKSKKARKIAVVGDNKGWTPQMTMISKDADVLVHEATLLEADPTRGHSTAAMAGKRAAECGAKLLVLNHISPKMESNLSQVVEEAYEEGQKQTKVLMSFDFLELLVPWMGFEDKS